MTVNWLITVRKKNPDITTEKVIHDVPTKLRSDKQILIAYDDAFSIVYNC